MLLKTFYDSENNFEFWIEKNLCGLFYIHRFKETAFLHPDCKWKKECYNYKLVNDAIYTSENYLFDIKKAPNKIMSKKFLDKIKDLI